MQMKKELKLEKKSDLINMRENNKEKEEILRFSKAAPLLTDTVYQRGSNGKLDSFNYFIGFFFYHFLSLINTKFSFFSYNFFHFIKKNNKPIYRCSYYIVSCPHSCLYPLLCQPNHKIPRR